MSAAATPSLLVGLSAELSDLVGRVAPSLVAVRSPRSRASGFTWQPHLIVTAEEALADDGEISVDLPDGSTAAAAIVGRDPSTDIALLRVEAALQPATLSAPALAAGGLVVAVGSAQGQPLAALGTVAQSGPAWRSLRGGSIDARIELGLTLRREAEGGLVVDANGHAFGMVVFGPSRRVLVIPTGTIERVAAMLRIDGRIARGYLGLGLHPISLPDGGTGVMIMSVAADGPGAAAGLLQGDVITGWNGRSIETLRAVQQDLGSDSIGRTVALSLRRAGADLQVTLTVAERPSP
ncbi:S1C family serine protease [Methylobacterium durans]|uniref:Serine protease n=1 Tax=Methylobacterium durans TaxID=2202825 RepID=A0A2U8W267_9HYPH|nr:S1C family serine protease [Methylobacterium durans]AWN39731.1 serine protease [Methylobacterium durans]